MPKSLCLQSKFHWFYFTYLRCEGCVETLFTRPSAACPECNTALRRNDFRVQQFEDLIVEKEVDIRKRILKMWVTMLKLNTQLFNLLFIINSLEMTNRPSKTMGLAVLNFLQGWKSSEGRFVCLVSYMTSDHLRVRMSRPRNWKSQNVSGTQKERLVAPSPKVSYLPFTMCLYIVLGFLCAVTTSWRMTSNQRQIHYELTMTILKM